ncbi:cytochrome c [Mesorhizobium sp. KR2-14]|uniref:cytochrome c n=1 Tax=Mesorhizobium sp. KR2-14 TaxID=3156610 RepID=UPI0032B4AF77
MIRQALLCAPLLLSLSTAVVATDFSGSEIGAAIEARRGLMQQTALLAGMVDMHLNGATEDQLFTLSDLANATAQSLDAFALLFPPKSNLQGGADPIEGVATTSAAHVWDDLPAFQQLIRDTAADAREAARAETIDAFVASWGKVAPSCASCHENFVSYDPFGSL